MPSNILEYFRRRKPALLSNPHFLRDVELAEKFFGGDFDYAGWMEAPEEPITCSVCGGKAYYKVSVGGYVCTKCGKVLK